MNSDKIREARELLDLPDHVSREEIRAVCRARLRRWHPDTGGDSTECAEMTRRILAARATLLAYCDSFQFDLSDEALSRHRSDQEWWHDRFGKNPLWRS